MNYNQIYKYANILTIYFKNKFKGFEIALIVTSNLLLDVTTYNFHFDFYLISKITPFK